MLCSSCSFFPSTPPLPKRGVIETAAAPRAPDEFAEVVARADLFYVPTDRVAWALRRDSGWRLIEELRRVGLFAIGWESVAADEQSMLDDAQVSPASSGSTMFVLGAPPERQHSLELMRQTRALGVAQLGLRCPRSLEEKMRRGDVLNAAERESLPTGFTTRPADSSAPTDRGTAPSIRATQLELQFVAEQIIQRLRAHPAEKLLVFLDRHELETTDGVPSLVAQKSNVRQLVLESKGQADPRARLLTGNQRDGPLRLLEIEDGTPGAGGHQF